jgi:hypothetical protein
MQVNLKTENSTLTLLNIPGVLTVTSFPLNAKDRKIQNYPAYLMPDGSNLVLEAGLKLYPPMEPKGPRDMAVGIPLGHASKFGKGGHYFEHISTTDFKTWTEHDAATPIEEQWETFGTGTPFIYDNKLSISYGLHTTRIYPKEKTTLPLQWDYYNKHSVTGSFRYDTIPGYPAGSTYSISEDGISKFKKTKILFHPCENPSVYTDPEGRLRMLANYGAKGT